MLRPLRLLAEKVTGYSIVKQMPFGIDEYADLKAKFKNFKFQTIIDVGANVGQSALQVRENFPDAEIYSLEPIKATYDELVRNTSGANVKTFNVGLGSSNQQVEVNTQVDNQNSVMNSLVAEKNSLSKENTKTEIVEILTLENFCEQNKISKIDFLKIDTEGFDLEVLKGAVGLLEKQAIPFILTEVSMNPTNTYHVDFVEMKHYMESFSYYIFGIYEQVQEWQTKTPILRRSNILFISKAMAFGKQ